MYKIMSNQCRYSEIHYEALEPTILVEETAIWHEQETDDIQNEEDINFDTADNVDNSLTETVNESYMTADSNNTTQYFSVLDSTNQTILNDINDVTINNSIITENTIEPQIENNTIDVNNGQVVLFKVDNSEDLYGFQLIHDEDGNLQKYQFKVRQNIEGNLEAIPETLQILPVENEIMEDVENEAEDDTTVAFENSEEAQEHLREENELIPADNPLCIKEEQFINEEQDTPEFDEEETFEEQLDTKEGILDVSTVSMQKRELEDDVGDTQSSKFPENIPEVSEEVENSHLHEEEEEEDEDVDDDDDEEEEEEEDQEVYYTHEDVALMNNFYENGVDDSVNEGDTVNENAVDEHYEELFIKESHLMDDINGLNHGNEQQEGTVIESDNEEYETVDGVHVTGDDENVYQNTDIRKSPSYQRSTISSRKKIIRNVIRKVRIQKNDGKANLFYLVKNTEKENMGQAPSNSITTRPNPRSILKCSIAAVEPQKVEEEEEEEKYDKRFAKSKEAQQARLFHNFIAQTKIIHAPIRQERLPRKQQIKPMKRIDEEIVVQEVVVSSNGFIETSEEGILKERIPLKPTEFIQLTDSDDDFDPKAPNKKKRKSKKRKPIEITISDSEEVSSEKSVMDDDENNMQTLKRPRGRPPKQQQDFDEEKLTTKRPRGRPPKHPKSFIPNLPEEEIIVIKIDNKCPKCPKSFPSEGSLRSHMQYHNFSQSKPNDDKYICEKCGDTFKNNFLLNRHIDSHKTNNISCKVCKKIFKDQAELSCHKRMHIKEKMFKITTLPKDSPKSIKISKKVNINKCENCGKVFNNISALNIHKKQHKNFSCQSCHTSFISKFMLENHFRIDCVKKKSPKKRKHLSLNIKEVFRSPRVLLKPRQSAILSVQFQQEQKPQEKLGFIKPITSSNKVITNIKCDSCSMTFATYTSLYKHKVLKHGLDTPDRSIVKQDSKKSIKRKVGHSGVPPSEKLRNAYMGLRSKLGGK